MVCEQKGGGHGFPEAQRPVLALLSTVGTEVQPDREHKPSQSCLGGFPDVSPASCHSGRSVDEETPAAPGLGTESVATAGARLNETPQLMFALCFLTPTLDSLLCPFLIMCTQGYWLVLWSYHRERSLHEIQL